MALSQATLVTRVRRLLDDDPYEGRITTAYTAGGTIVTDDGTKWAVGDWGEFDETPWDHFLVRSISTNTLTVKSGHHNTTDTNHTDEIAIKKAPFYAAQQVIRAIEQTIQELWPHAWKSIAGSVTPSTTTVWYDGAATWLGLISVNQRHGTSDREIGLFGAAGTGRSVILQRNLPTGLVASTVGVRFPGGFFHSSNTVNVAARGAITTTIASSNYSDVDDGLLAEALIHGAAAKLVGAKGIPRVGEDTTQGEATVRPRDRFTAAAWYEAEYRRVLHAFNLYLRDTLPPMGVW